MVWVQRVCTMRHLCGNGDNQAAGAEAGSSSSSYGAAACPVCDDRQDGVGTTGGATAAAASTSGPGAAACRLCLGQDAGACCGGRRCWIPDEGCGVG